jgi:hypothetical protein
MSDISSYVPKKWVGKTYNDLLKTVVIDRSRDEWNHPLMEDIASSVGLFVDSVNIYDEVQFLFEYESAATWLCTDTIVGIFFLFMDKDGERVPIGGYTQIGRKWPKQYFYFTPEYREWVGNKILALITPDLTNSAPVIDVNESI